MEFAEINRKIVDRSRCFYWQTDREIDPPTAGAIFSDRHGWVDDSEVQSQIALDLKLDRELIKLAARNLTDQTEVGNVNAVRTLVIDGEEFILRMHPRGLANGYFAAESLAALTVLQSGSPSYRTLFVGELTKERPFAYMVIQKLRGESLTNILKEQPDTERELTVDAGRKLAELHAIPVAGFGFFDNARAKDGELTGIHRSAREHILSGLPMNLRVLQQNQFLTEREAAEIAEFCAVTRLFELDQSFLIHNDFADWNLLGREGRVTGVLDWDESFAGDPVADIACWTTFHGLTRLPFLLEGYEEVGILPDDYELRFWAYRLRYLVSKLTLRLRRLTWDHGPNRSLLEARVATGRAELEECFSRVLPKLA